MKNLIKGFIKFTGALVFLALAHAAIAADFVASYAIVDRTPTNILSGGKYVITDVLFISSTNATQNVKFYDSTGITTNYVQAAYTNYTTVSTNWTTTFTNATGVIITNTFTGISHVPTAVALATNELPAKLQFLVAGSGTRQLSGLAVQPTRGITVYATGYGTLEIGYRKIEP